MEPKPVGWRERERDELARERERDELSMEPEPDGPPSYMEPKRVGLLERRQWEDDLAMERGSDEMDCPYGAGVRRTGGCGAWKTN